MLVTVITVHATVTTVATVVIAAVTIATTTTVLTADLTVRSLAMEPIIQEWKFFLETEPTLAEASLYDINGPRIKALLTEYMVYNDLAVVFLKENNLEKCKFYIDSILEDYTLDHIEQLQRLNVCKTILIYLDAQATADRLLLSDSKYQKYIDFMKGSTNAEIKAFMDCVLWVNSYKLVEANNPLNFESVELTFELSIKNLLDTIKAIDLTYYYLIIRNVAMVKRYLKKTYESDEYLMLLPE